MANKKTSMLFDMGIGSIFLSGIAYFTLTVNPVIPQLLAVGGAIGLAYDWANKDKFEDLWEGLGLKEGHIPSLRETIRTNYGVCYRFGVPSGDGVSDFAKRNEAIQQYLDNRGICNRLEIKYKKGGNMLWEVYEKELKHEYDYEFHKTKGSIEVPIGYTYGEKLVTIDFVKAVHVLLAGETDSGKSTILRNIITYLLAFKDVDFYLCDLKNGNEFKMFMNYENVKEWTKEPKAALELLSKAKEEYERRVNLFFKKDVTSIYEYNQKYKKAQLKHEIIVIDEMSQLRNKESKDSLTIIEDLSQLARSVGIHLLVGTQKPSIKDNVITSLMKGNFPTTIGLKTHGQTESMQILDEVGLEKLRGYGHGILKLKGNMTEFQAFNMSTIEAKRILEENCKKKPPKTEEKQQKTTKNSKKTNKIDKKLTEVDVKDENIFFGSD